MSQITFIDKKKHISNDIGSITAKTFISKKHHYLKKMHLCSLWLKCDCVSRGAISFVRLNKNTYSLINKGTEGEHAQDCPLWTLVNQGEGEPLPPSKGKKINKFNPVPIADNASKGGNVKDAGRRNRKSRGHSIHNLLCSLLAGKKSNGSIRLNQYHAEKIYNLHDAYNSNTASAVVCKLIKVKDLLSIPPKLKYAVSKSKIDKIKDRFDSKTAPQLYTILLVDDLDYSNVEKTIKIHKGGRVKTINFNNVTHSYPRTSGPRICFIVQAIIDSVWTNQIIYTHPIVSPEHPIMVDSDLERQFFIKLVKQLPEKAVINKPYFCDDYKGRILKPDFIVSNGESDKDKRKSVVVEVMGLVDDPEYRERKRELIPMMRNRYKSGVIEVLPDSLDDSIDNIIQIIS